MDDSISSIKAIRAKKYFHCDRHQKLIRLRAFRFEIIFWLQWSLKLFFVKKCFRSNWNAPLPQPPPPNATFPKIDISFPMNCLSICRFFWLSWLQSLLYPNQKIISNLKARSRISFWCLSQWKCFFALIALVEDIESSIYLSQKI